MKMTMFGAGYLSSPDGVNTLSTERDVQTDRLYTYTTMPGPSPHNTGTLAVNRSTTAKSTAATDRGGFPQFTCKQNTAAWRERRPEERSEAQDASKREFPVVTY